MYSLLRLWVKILAWSVKNDGKEVLCDALTVLSAAPVLPQHDYYRKTYS